MAYNCDRLAGTDRGIARGSVSAKARRSGGAALETARTGALVRHGRASTVAGPAAVTSAAISTRSFAAALHVVGVGWASA